MRGTRNQRANILDAIAQLRGAGDAAEGRAPMRMKIMVRKEDLKQVLEVIRDGRTLNRRGSASTAAAASLEQRLNSMRKRHVLRAASRRSGPGSWRPVLQSIPEEI